MNLCTTCQRELPGDWPGECCPRCDKIAGDAMIEVIIANGVRWSE